MERRKLTEEDVERAEDYIPLAQKYAVARMLAPGCIERVEGTPPIWRENVIGRRLAARYILSGFYLHITDVSGLYREEPEFQFTLEDCDRLSRLEWDLSRLGGDRCGEIMADFREFLDILEREIHNLLTQRNDILSRLGELAAVSVTPELLRQLQQAAAPQGGEAD